MKLILKMFLIIGFMSSLAFSALNLNYTNLTQNKTTKELKVLLDKSLDIIKQKQNKITEYQNIINLTYTYKINSNDNEEIDRLNKILKLYLIKQQNEKQQIIDLKNFNIFLKNKIKN